MARDRIYLRDVRARCVIGVDEAERQAKQDVVMNVTLEVDLSAAGRSDRIEDT
ncbi:MAG: dihydroneopterin aldolase, partial [Phycisphaerae bacterium]|nr:dihydroneopterin aldolase [Phycisphaerae bacterium]